MAVAPALTDRVQRHREEILRICAKHGALNVRVFGSVARGDAGADSDLDLLVEAGENTTPWWPGGLVADLEDLLGCRVQVVTEQGLNLLFRETVLAEARPL
ncbi:nucleotidyltransferase family protein [bacterium]|nr:nucleotidyltransferase family protein [bacterium]